MLAMRLRRTKVLISMVDIKQRCGDQSQCCDVKRMVERMCPLIGIEKHFFMLSTRTAVVVCKVVQPHSSSQVSSTIRMQTCTAHSEERTANKQLSAAICKAQTSARRLKVSRGLWRCFETTQPTIQLSR